MATVLVTFEAEAGQLRSTLDTIGNESDKLQEKASKNADELIAKYKEQLKASVAAFSSQEVKKSLEENTRAIESIEKEITKLINEENRLVKARMTSTDSYKKNQDAGMKLREELEKLRIKEQLLTDSTGKTENKFKSLRLQLREAKLELQKLEDTGQEGTNQFNEMAIAVAKLEDRVGDLNERTKVLSSDTFKFDVAVDAAQQLAGAFAIAQGAATLFGDENQDLQKAIAKTTAAMSILQGVQQLGKFVTGQSSAAIALQTTLQKINEASVKSSATTYTLFGRTIQFTTLQLNIMKGALAATGIGLFVAIIAILVQKMDEISSKTEKYNETLKKSAEGSKEAQEAIKDLKKVQEDYASKISVLSGSESQASVDRKQAQAEAKKTYTDAFVKRVKELKDIDAAMVKAIARERELATAVQQEKDKLAKQGQGEGGLFGEATKGVQLKRKEEALKAEKDSNAATRVAFEQGQKDRIGLIKTYGDTTKEINQFYDLQELKDQKEKNEKAYQESIKAADEKLQILQNTLKREEVINGASLKNKEAQAEVENKIAINNIKGSTKNLELRNSKLLLLESEYKNKLVNIKIDELNKVAAIELESLKNKQTIVGATFQSQKDIAEKEFTIAKNNAEKLKANDLEYKAALEKAQTDYNAKIISLETKLQSDTLQLKTQGIELNIALNGETLQSTIDLINAQAEQRRFDIKNSQESDEIKKSNTLKVNAETNKAIEVATLTSNQKLLQDKRDTIAQLVLDEKDTLQDRIKDIQYAAEQEILEQEKLLGKTEEFEKQKKKIVAQTESAVRDERERTIREAIAKAEEYLNAFQNVTSQIGNLSKALGDAYIEQVNSQKEKELQAINDSSDLESDKQRKRVAAEKRASNAIAAEKGRQARLDKNLAYFNAVINTAAAIAKVVNNPVLVSLAAIAGALQIATILATPIPKFKKGGVVGGKLHSDGGTMIEAEKGEYIVNRNQYARHSNEINAINESTQAFRKLVHDRYVKPAIINYMLGKKTNESISVNATLNSQTMESEIRGLRSDIRRSVKSKSNNTNIDSRYVWQ